MEQAPSDLPGDLRKYLPRPFKAMGARLLDFLLPPRCLSCGDIMQTAGALCPDCWGDIRFIEQPCCVHCGVPFEFETRDGSVCVSCLDTPPAYDQARSVFRYDENSRKLILAFKYGDRTDAAPAFGRWLARSGAQILEKGDILVPVPLHRLRLFSRRYNQAALIAQALSKETGLPHGVEMLRRVRATRPQGRMGKGQRQKNMRGAFVLGEKEPGLEGRHVVLIDDVMASGATAQECAHVLVKGGAREVSVLTLARAVLPD